MSNPQAIGQNDIKIRMKEAEACYSMGMIADALYDLEGDACWITKFRIKPRSLKCLGLCSHVSFDIMVLKQN